MQNEVWITGVGLLSSLGEGTKKHANALASQTVNVDVNTFKPYPVHPLQETDWEKQIPRRDQRQMNTWQLIGTYAAGLALEDANAKDEKICGEMDMIVSAGGGEVDLNVYADVLKEIRRNPKTDKDEILIQKLSNELRPTLFLTQLSNLLAGNISIVHKVTGSSRTFMGEEGAGLSALKTAHARIQAGQSQIAIVGGAFNCERQDILVMFELVNALCKGEHKPVAERDKLILGSAGAFVILENKNHAEKRNTKPYARITNVNADFGNRNDGDIKNRLAQQLKNMGEADGVMSGASGAEMSTKEENDALNLMLPNAPVAEYGTITGHCMEAHTPLGIALAAIAVRDKVEVVTKNKTKTKMNSVIVTSVGHWHGEGITKVEAI